MSDYYCPPTSVQLSLRAYASAMTYEYSCPRHVSRKIYACRSWPTPASRNPSSTWRGVEFRAIYSFHSSPAVILFGIIIIYYSFVVAYGSHSRPFTHIIIIIYNKSVVTRLYNTRRWPTSERRFPWRPSFASRDLVIT